MAKAILAAIPLLFTLPLQAQPTARPIELVCSGYLSNAGERQGRTTISVAVDMASSSANVTGLPFFQPYNFPVTVEPHQFWGAVPGFSLFISRVNMQISYSAEDWKLEGVCQHQYQVI